MALSFDDIYNSTGETRTFIITDAQTIAVDDLVAEDTAGTVRRLADTSNFNPFGRCVGFTNLASRTTEVGASGESPVPRAILETGRHTLRGVSVTGVSAQTDVGDDVFASDHETLTLTPTSNIPSVGTVVEFHSGTICDVAMFSLEDMRSE